VSPPLSTVLDSKLILPSFSKLNSTVFYNSWI
jgi:hypothetical protein